MKQRQSVERPRIVEAIAEARSHGDLSENAEYHAAKEAQSHNEGRIAELEDKLARADIIDVSKLSGDTIMFGATVTLIDEDTEKKAVWQIVGEPEADAKKGRISITSPLARALIGKKKGTSRRSHGSGRRQGLRDHQSGLEVDDLPLMHCDRDGRDVPAIFCYSRCVRMSAFAGTTMLWNVRRSRLTILMLAVTLTSTVARAAEINIPPPKPKELPVHINQPNCSRWTDECVNCSRGADGGAPVCSNIGFACQPKAIRCIQAEIPQSEPQKK